MSILSPGGCHAFVLGGNVGSVPRCTTSHTSCKRMIVYSRPVFPGLPSKMQRREQDGDLIHCMEILRGLPDSLRISSFPLFCHLCTLALNVPVRLEVL